jgi:hypothetical protein
MRHDRAAGLSAFMEPHESSLEFSAPTPPGCLAATVGLFLVGFAALAG